MMRTNVKPERLERAAAPDPPARNQAATFVSKQTQDSVYEKKLNFKQDIDVRGMRGDEAIHAVTDSPVSAHGARRKRFQGRTRTVWRGRHHRSGFGLTSDRQICTVNRNYMLFFQRDKD